MYAIRSYYAQSSSGKSLSQAVVQNSRCWGGFPELSKTTHGRVGVVINPRFICKKWERRSDRRGRRTHNERRLKVGGRPSTRRVGQPCANAVDCRLRALGEWLANRGQ